jgi:hypothetical protein
VVESDTEKEEVREDRGGILEGEEGKWKRVSLEQMKLDGFEEGEGIFVVIVINPTMHQR